MSDFELIFFAAVIGFLGYKLWSVLGRTNGDEAARASDVATFLDKTRAAKEAQTQAKTNIIELSKIEAAKEEEEIPAHLKTDVEAAKKIDPAFTLKKFVSGAAGAFELVIEGFAEKKRDALKFLLSKELYDGFESEIKKREEDGQEASSSVVSLHAPEILDVELKGSICHIVVKFISEQINFIKDKAGEIIEGSKSQIDHVTEIWTFERDLSSKKPNWTVVGIQAA